MKRSLLISVVIAGLAVMIAGCRIPGTSQVPGKTARQAFKQLVGVWSLVELQGEAVSSTIPPESPQPWLEFDAGTKVFGFAGVNQFGGLLEYESLVKGRLALGVVATTRMAGSPEAMDFERRFLDGLDRATGFMIDDGDLVLTEKSGVLMRFVPK